jgi:hypothetical protein
MGGTVYSAETRRSNLVCSGTERIPERCFGNSGENRSAGRKQVEEITDKRVWLKQSITAGWRYKPFLYPISDPQ